MFVDEQCHDEQCSSRPLSEAMRTAFTDSKAVRIGWTKIILSHPQCIFWYFARYFARRRSRKSYSILNREQIPGEYKDEWSDIHDVLHYFERESKVEFVRNWVTQVDYLWHCEDTLHPIVQYYIFCLLQKYFYLNI